MIFPKPLGDGDKIAIVSPASKIDVSLVDRACECIENWGFRPVVSESCKSENGSFSGTLGQRLNDFLGMLSDDSVKAILCSRGGYGTVHLLPYFQKRDWIDNSKWIIGFSDISALHAVAGRYGIASVHASMCKHLAEHSDDLCSRYLHDILTGGYPEYILEGDSRNREGRASGRIAGGNMAVLSGLISTPFDLLRKDHILFIEDIAEPIYKIERMLYTLKLNGTLENTRALIVGQFTEYKPSADYQSMYDMIEEMVSDYDFPVAYNFPIGHVDYNLPIIEGCDVELSVSKDEVKLKFIKPE